MATTINNMTAIQQKLRYVMDVIKHMSENAREQHDKETWTGCNKDWNYGRVNAYEYVRDLMNEQFEGEL